MCDALLGQQHPGVAGHKQRAVVEPNHARILRTPEGMGVDQLRLLGPGASQIAGPDEHERAVRVAMGAPGCEVLPPLRSTAEGNEQFSIGTGDDGGKRGVGVRVLVDEDVFEFAHDGLLAGWDGVKGESATALLSNITGKRTVVYLFFQSSRMRGVSFLRSCTGIIHKSWRMRPASGFS